MKKMIFIGVFCLAGIFLAGSSQASDTEVESGPWEKVSLKFGGFLSRTNTSFRLGSGAGVDIDVEELLGLSVENAVYRIGGLWRFTNNRRHRLDLSWFRLHRSGENTIGQEIEVPGEGGDDTVTIPAGTKVESYFNLDIYQAAYSYSLLQDDRIDLAGSAGLYLMPLDFGLKATGIFDGEGSAKFTAPLPTIGFRMDIVLAPKWYFRVDTKANTKMLPWYVFKRPLRRQDRTSVIFIL